MPSNFQGTWRYIRHRSLGNTDVMEFAQTIVIKDGADGNPNQLDFTEPASSTTTTLDVDSASTTSYAIKVTKGTTHRGQLVITWMGTPPIMFGSLSKGVYREGGVGDNNTDVFVAVKVSP